jgi:ATP-dependent DNA helicase PIF1
MGIVSSHTQQHLAECNVKKKPLPEDGIVPTMLYCTNHDVDLENRAQLDAIDSEELVFKAKDSFSLKTQSEILPEDEADSDMADIDVDAQEITGKIDANTRKTLRELVSRRVPAELSLKIGAQVILLMNWPKRGLVNGSRGQVVGFHNERVRVLFDTGETVMIGAWEFTQEISSATLLRRQLPLRLGWAMTVHRAQGMTLSRAHLKVDRAFEAGQAYVALSRIKDTEGLWLSGKGISQSRTWAHPEALNYYSSLCS